MLKITRLVVALTAITSTAALADASDGPTGFDLCMFKEAVKLDIDGVKESAFDLARASSELCSEADVAVLKKHADDIVMTNNIAKLSGFRPTEIIRWQGTATDLLQAWKEKAVPRVAARLLSRRASMANERKTGAED